ncbi:unnamed protein product [Heligmosomoides polygyrus]|uniref:Mediator of RNA polymerase II transcription subunit 13 n=1 Tax=Heligmosomoides polygyrus TaxID=6339 RepID=A0A183G8C0_HELPZ|nr:unnamed protein product [Heligmosomoides polygyrus]
MSTLQQLSGLSAPLLPGSALGAAQWASSQSSGQAWIDPAKVAAMLPMYQVFTGVKGLDISQPELIGQQNIAPVSGTLSSTTSSSSIFPTSVVKTTLTKSSSGRHSPQISAPHNSPGKGVLSNGPSSHPSTSTPNDIDVGVLSQPSSQTQAYDLTVRQSAAKSPRVGSSQNFAAQPSTSFKTHSMVESQPTTSQSSGQSAVEDNWASIIDLGDLDLFAGASSKENESEIPSVFELGGNLFPHSSQESQQKITSFSAPSMSHSAANNSATEITAADQEFDQIFSSLENNNTATNAFSFDFHGGENNPSLSPVQFTPPDSPSVVSPEPTNMMGLFAGPSTSSARPPSPSLSVCPPAPTPSLQTSSSSKRKSDFVKPIAAPSPSSFKKEPLVTRPVQKCNKVPIYKQRRFTMISSNENSSENKKDDAYSFDDEEENVCLGHVDPKDKLDAEVREKISRIAGQHPEGRHKNIYVPGVGFAVPPDQQQDLWRHVVPKKRPTGENRPIIPAANLLPPSVHAEASKAAARLAEPEIVTLAESIRRRRKERHATTFVKTEQTNEKDCAKEEGADHRAEQINKEYTLRVVERFHDGEHKIPRLEEERVDVSMLSKKRRLMMQWQEGQENQSRENGEHRVIVSSRNSEPVNDFNVETVKARLSMFGPADGHLPKGTFVVCKADLFRDDCALWRVDNQNMIQKYPPRIDPATRDVSYRNSSTYSGWCDKVAFGYYRVAIKHIKQTRSEAIIQPEVPISDLFPAIASECSDTNGFIKGEDESSASADDHVLMLRDPLRLSLHTFILAMINHALTLEFFQQLKGKNDWNFLRAVTEVEKVNSDSLKKLRGVVKFSEKFEDAIHSYTQLCVTESDCHSFLCQVSTLMQLVAFYLVVEYYLRFRLKHKHYAYRQCKSFYVILVLFLV